MVLSTQKTGSLLYLELAVLVFQVTDELVKKLRVNNISILYLAQIDQVRSHLMTENRREV